MWTPAPGSHLRHCPQEHTPPGLAETPLSQTGARSAHECQDQAQGWFQAHLCAEGAQPLPPPLPGSHWPPTHLSLLEAMLSSQDQEWASSPAPPSGSSLVPGAPEDGWAAPASPCVATPSLWPQGRAMCPGRALSRGRCQHGHQTPASTGWGSQTAPRGGAVRRRLEQGRGRQGRVALARRLSRDQRYLSLDSPVAHAEAGRGRQAVCMGRARLGRPRGLCPSPSLGYLGGLAGIHPR